MSAILVILSLLFVLGSVLFISDATLGVGIIGIAGVLAIWARIAQANDHHKMMMKKLDEVSPQPEPVTKE